MVCDKSPYYASDLIPQWGSHFGHWAVSGCYLATHLYLDRDDRIVDKGTWILWECGWTNVIITHKRRRICPHGWFRYTSRADSFWWRFEWKFFQSSFEFAILAWIPLAFSLVNRAVKSSPLESITFSLCCPFSLSDENSYKEIRKTRYHKMLSALKYIDFSTSCSIKSQTRNKQFSLYILSD